MDQVAELLGTLAFGWCITHHGSLVVLPVITLAALLALPLEIWCIQRVGLTALQSEQTCLEDADRLATTSAILQPSFWICQQWADLYIGSLPLAVILLQNLVSKDKVSDAVHQVLLLVAFACTLA